MVPADAEMVIEGHVLPNVKEVEGPFGEFTGYYGPQRLRNVIEVSAITHRRDAIFNISSRPPRHLGARRHSQRGSLFNLIRGVVPTVKAVHFPMSGACRFNCYISIDKKVDGETKQAALAALGGCDFVKHVSSSMPISIFTTKRKSCGRRPHACKRTRTWTSSRTSKETRSIRRRPTTS